MCLMFPDLALSFSHVQQKNVVTECNWNLIYFHGQWTRNANLLIFRAFCGLRLSENEMQNSGGWPIDWPPTNCWKCVQFRKNSHKENPWSWTIFLFAHYSPIYDECQTRRAKILSLSWEQDHQDNSNVTSQPMGEFQIRFLLLQLLWVEDIGEFFTTEELNVKCRVETWW